MYDPSAPSTIRDFFYAYARTPRWKKIFWALLFCATFATFAVAATLLFFSRDLPDYRQLIDYDPSKTTRVYANNGALIDEFAVEKRVFVSIDYLPERLIRAFMAAEDKNFYTHYGIDFAGILRAVQVNIRNLLLGNQQLVGASTITQQVAKNFLLTQEKTLTRKIKEAILAVRIDRTLDKNRIMELYLNEIYLGRQAYGVAAAARSYFGRDVRDLTLEHAAYLAALPKAPNRYNPKKNYEAALGRRNWVLKRMRVNGYIDQAQYEVARNTELITLDKPQRIEAKGSFFAEEMRRGLLEKFGERTLYHGGLVVFSSLDPQLQILAERALRKGIRTYDRRHGYRGVLGTILWRDSRPFVLEEGSSGLPDDFAKRELPVGALDTWELARIEKVSPSAAVIVTQRGERGSIALPDLYWAREQILPDLKPRKPSEEVEALVLRGGRFEIEEAESEKEQLGAEIKKVSDVLQASDVVLVSRKGGGAFDLEQVPQVNGALVALDPFSGRVSAMVGGWSFDESEFNRSTQALRQPGSSFKPFVYLAALENNFTPATRILDAPFVLYGGEEEAKWKPSNFSQKFYGPSPMRLGIEYSRNLMTVRLAQAVGMDKVADTARRFGVIDDMPKRLALALGSGETTLVKMVAAYAMFANGGRKITPSLIDRIQRVTGENIYTNDPRECPECRVSEKSLRATLDPPLLKAEGERVTDRASAYQIVTMLEGVVKRGTGRRVRAEVSGPIAGKTGTTNNNQDAWFVGFSPRLAAGVYIGFDQPRSLGRQPSGYQETGSSAAAPIFAEFMRGALQDSNTRPFFVPDSVEIASIDIKTGGLSEAGEAGFKEVFKLGNAPQSEQAGLLITGGEPIEQRQPETSIGVDEDGEAPELGIY